MSQTEIAAAVTSIAPLPVSCGGVVCESNRLTELEDGRVMVVVDRKHIRSIRLRYGLVSPHPILQLGAAVVLLGLGYFPTMHLFHWYRHGGAFFDIEAIMIPFVAIGLWLGMTAFRRDHFLEVDSTAGRKRLAFSSATDPAAIEIFVAAIEHHFGLCVKRDGN